MPGIATDTIATLADPTRRQIFEILSTGPHSVAEIARQLPVTRPAVSQHLAVLSRAALVTHQRVGTKHLYRLDPRGIAEIRTQLDRLWERALADFKTVAERSFTRRRKS
jgi:DNA-binding transcriptional ArsR family regulator